MANQNIEEIAAGETTEDEVLKKELVREVMYKQAGNLSVGTRVVGQEEFDALDVRFAYPGEMSAEYPVGMDSTTDRERITWEEFDITLRQAQSRYFIADSARLRGVDQLQQDFTQRRSGEALARRKDENILNTLSNAAPSSNTSDVPTGEEWDQDDVDIVAQLHSMWEDILVNAPINNANVDNFAVIVPIEVWTELNQVELINNVQQQIRDYLGDTFGFSIYPTKLGLNDDDQVNLQDTAIMMIPGEETAIHGVLTSEAASREGVPLVEEERVMGKGVEYLVKQWFNTGIMEHESGSADESPRVAVRTNVNSKR